MSNNLNNNRFLQEEGFGNNTSHAPEDPLLINGSSQENHFSLQHNASNINIFNNLQAVLPSFQQNNNDSNLNMNTSSWNPASLQQQAIAKVPQPATANNAQQLNGQLQGLAALLAQQQQQQQQQQSQGNNLVDWINLLLTNNHQNTQGALPQQQQQVLFPPQLQQPQQQQMQPSLAMFQNMAAPPVSVSPPPTQQLPQVVSQALPQQQMMPAAQLQGGINVPNQLFLANQMAAPGPSASHSHHVTQSNDLEEILRKLQNQVASVNNNNNAAAPAVLPGNSNLASMYSAPPPGFPFPSDVMLSKMGVASNKTPEPNKHSKPKHAKAKASHPALKTMPPPQPILAGTTQDKQILLYRDIDDFYLTEYQCLLRQQIELFEATVDDVQASAQGRNSPIEVGQVGIRCKYCSTLPLKCRTRGAVYFPRSIDGIYQVAQNLTKIHLCQGCSRVPENLKKKLTELSKVNKRASGGKRYWNERVRELGVYEDGKGIRFKKATAAAVSS